MKICFAATGLDQELYWTKAVNSIRCHNPDAHTIWIPDEGSFTKSMNCYLDAFCMDYDWHFIIDDDVICNGVVDMSMLHNTTIYGNQVITKWFNWHYLDGWILAVPKRIAEYVRFDSRIPASGFEDYDFCKQVVAQGGNWKQHEFPFHHISGQTKKIITKNYDEVRLSNIDYVREKWSL